MSFLSGLKKVGSWVTGSSFSANLAKTAIIGYTVYRLNRNLNKANNPQANIDEGVRLQVNPSAENKIPVVYGAAFLSGIITDAEMSGNNKTMHFCLTISEKTGTVFSTNQASTTTFREVYYNDQRVTFKADGVTVDFTQDRSGVVDRSLEGRVRIFCYDGNSAAPRGVQGFATPSTNAADLIPSWNPSTHQMNNLVFAVVRVDYDRDRGVTSLGTVKFHIENSMTRPGDCLFDYFTNTIYGASVPATEVNVSTLSELNTYSDQSVVFEDQVLGPNQVLTARYRINGVVDTDKSVLDNIENIASSAASWISYDVQLGQWSVVINKDATAVAVFDDSTVIGSVSINGTGIEDLYNRVKAEFPNRDIRDSADFVTIALPAQDRNVNEYENTLNIVYELINEPVQAEILGFIELKQSRVDLVVRWTTDYSFTTLTSGDVVTLTNARIGWVNKLFRIVAVNERQVDGEQLLVDLTALEYDADVYSVSDLFRFTRSDQNGIITIGSIGVPGTPVVSKIEIDSRPRIIATSTSPTGIVERMEFWRTTDVSVAEAQRNYTLVGTVLPVGGGTFGIGENVTFEYDNQGAGNFLIKTRGVNSITTGQFSEPSGIIEFQPQQVTDTIGPNTSLSGIVGALGALELLNLIDSLMKNSAGEGGLFDKIFSVFEEQTGTDLVGQTVQKVTEIPVFQDGLLVDGFIKALKFTGAGVEVDTDVSSNITINIPGGTGEGGGSTVNVINDLADVNTVTRTPQTGDRLIWDGTNFIPDGLGTGTIPDPDPTQPGQLGACGFSFSALFPPDKSEASDSFPEAGFVNGFSPDKAPITGSYFVRFNVQPFGGQLQRGTTGNARLYKSNGTLVQALSFNAINIDRDTVELPFGTRERGVDYYIAMDAGMVATGFGCLNNAINPSSWNFNTPWEDIAPYNIPGLDIPINPVCEPVFHRDFQARGKFPLASIFISTSQGNVLVPQFDKTKASRHTDLYFTFNVPVVLNGAGFVDIYTAAGELVQRIDGAQETQGRVPGNQHDLLFCTGRILRIDPTVDLTPGQSYYVVVGPNVIRNTCRLVWSGLDDEIYTAFTIDAGPVAAAPALPSNGSINEEPLALTFDRPVVAGPGSITIRDGSNNIVGTVASNSPAVTYTQGVA